MSTPGPTFGTTGVQVARIGLGTWKMEPEARAAVEALRHGVALGMTHVDTAELYGDGAVETLVGKALQGVRDQVFLTSKVHPDHATRDGIERACAASLRRLRTDRLDLYLLHWVSRYPMEEQVAAFEALVAAGKIRFWGVSNFDRHKLAQMRKLAGPGRIACNQVLHHLGEREIEADVVPMCRREGIAVVGYTPFGRGRFPPGAAQKSQRFAQIAASVGATPRQLALAFLVHVSNGFAIPKAVRMEHVDENAGAARLRLGADVLTEIEKLYPAGG